MANSPYAFPFSNLAGFAHDSVVTRANPPALAGHVASIIKALGWNAIAACQCEVAISDSAPVLATQVAQSAIMGGVPINDFLSFASEFIAEIGSSSSDWHSAGVASLSSAAHDHPLALFKKWAGPRAPRRFHKVVAHRALFQAITAVVHQSCRMESLGVQIRPEGDDPAAAPSDPAAFWGSRDFEPRVLLLLLLWLFDRLIAVGVVHLETTSDDRDGTARRPRQSDGCGPGRRRLQIARICSQIRACPIALLIGDFNAVASAEELAALLMAGFKPVPCVGIVSEGGEIIPDPDPATHLGHQLRIDGAFQRGLDDLAPQYYVVRLPNEGPGRWSDHRPIIVTLDSPSDQA